MVISSSILRVGRSIVLLLPLALAPAAIAHIDDPKERDLLPPYVGPGYRHGLHEAMPQQFAYNGVKLLSWVTLAEFDETGGANDCWGYVSPSGDEYAIIGLGSGTGFVNVTDPALPQIVGVIDGPVTIWRDVKVFQHYAYVVAEAWASGIQVIDLGSIDNGFVELLGTVSTGGSTMTHNVAIDTDSGYLYRCGGASHGLRIYSLADPVDPQFVGSWNLRYVHDVQVVTFSRGPYAGRQIAFACTGFSGGYVEPGLDILDVSDKSNIIQVARLLYPNARYAHQGWLSEDRQYFFLGDEMDEDGFTPTTTYVIDVSNLFYPFVLDTFTNGNTSVGHNMYVHGNLLFEANYSSGLRVFDISDPRDVSEIAFFDTRPEDDMPMYVGLWSNYPYFPSGTIIGSDRQRGLFVWRLGLPEPLPEDIDGDGEVDVFDLLLLLSDWGPCPDPPADCRSDIDGDGQVSFSDLLKLLNAWTR